MKNFLEGLLLKFLHLLLWFRYKIEFKGVENLTPKNLSHPGGVLFLPNHPAVFVDPVLVTIGAWKKYPTRHLIVEYMYYTPVVHSVMKWLNALPVPNNEVSSNSLKRKKGERAFSEVVKGLKKGENFIIYPAGRLKATPQEIIGGASGAHRILQESGEINIVLVRLSGLWGSTFSKAFTGLTPPMFPVIKKGFISAVKSFLFFLPRRKIVVEYVPAPADFPYHGTRVEVNRWLENWYNSDYGEFQSKEGVGEKLNLVSTSCWREEYPEKNYKKQITQETIDLTKIPQNVKDKILERLSQITERPVESITPQMKLATDLGLDSLDGAELAVFLEDQYDIRGISVMELTTVARTMAIAGKQIILTPSEDDSIDYEDWKQPVKRKKVDIAPGKCMQEVFLNSCTRMGKAIAIGDQRSGILSFADVKLRAILLAEKIRDLPGENIGILLPSSVAATLTFFACQLAGKVPVMINWTVGFKHLESVVESAGIKCVLSSWAFLDRLSNIDFTCIEDSLIMLEDMRRDIKLKHKLKAFWMSKKSTAQILKHFHLEHETENDRATIIFTSGTENLPKGVPLTHSNLLSNQRAVLKVIEIFTDDVLFAMLPPFHSFGLTVSSTLGLLAGLKIAYFPDPTDGKRVAKGVEQWQATIICGAPTFLKNMLKAAEPGQLKTLRYVVSGAEKAPLELFQLVEANGLKGTLIEGYGITECSPVLTVNMGTEKSRGVGAPIPGVELLIIHPETHEILPTGEQGLILARGPNVFSGYLNKGLASPFITVDGKEWYVTGDLGFLDENNQLTISGRLKRFIKVGSEMISLAAIEDAVLKIAHQKGWPLVEEGPSIAICAMEQVGERPKIYLFSRFYVELEEINYSLKEVGMGNLIKITVVKQVEIIPLMGTGKTNYRELESTLKEG